MFDMKSNLLRPGSSEAGKGTRRTWVNQPVLVIVLIASAETPESAGTVTIELRFTYFTQILYVICAVKIVKKMTKKKRPQAL